ncbi:MAG: DUF1501 domain-containing protein, partial [Kiritimatiellia bacterium]
MNHPSPPLSRRRFLGQASCSAVTAVPVMNTLLNLSMAGRVAAAEPNQNEYRALVCVFLSGGNDSFNMLVPRGNSEYAEYATVRSGLALAQNSLLAINPVNNPGRALGLHPSMPELRDLFEQGHASFVANVGTLIEPVTKAEYAALSKALPLGLYSHSDQIEQWQTSIPHARSGIGWGGRMADLLHQLNDEQRVSMNISLSGSNIWQAGNEVYDYSITDGGAVELTGYEPKYAFTWGTEQIRSAAIESQMSLQYTNLLQQTFASSKRNA